MSSNIIVVDGSRKLHLDNTLAVLADIQDIRGFDRLNVEAVVDYDFVDKLARQAYNRSRRQVDTHEMLARLSLNDFLHRQNANAGKIIILDDDLYSSNVPGMNWCFGVTSSYNHDNKYILVSTARFGNDIHAQHIIRHELGHMFGAPNPSRKDVYESLGEHCGSKECVMKQELSQRNSFQQAMDAYRKGIKYCIRCQNDIRRY